MPEAELLTAILDSMRLPVTSIDPAGTILFVNSLAAKNLSKTREELIGTSLYDYFPDHTVAIRERIRQALVRRTVQHFEAVVSLPDGRTRRFDSAYYPTLNDDGEVISLQIVAHDITDLRAGDRTDVQATPDWSKVTDDLSMTDDRVKAILANAAMIISVYDPDTTIRYMNRVLDGIELADIIGKSPLDWVTEDSKPVLRAAFDDVVATKQIAECAVEGLSGRTWLVRLTPLVFDDTVTQILGCTLDITERTRLQAQLSRRRKIESLGTMARGIAHDFNNLLTAIMGDTGLARRKLATGGDILPLLEEIDTASHRAADLCEQMLIYAGREQPTNEPGDLNAVIEGLTPLTRAATGARITVTHDLAVELPPAKCHRAQLGQVVLNLINNAADAIGDEAGHIRVSTKEIELVGRECRYYPEPPPPGRYLQLQVEDSGHGVSADDRHLLFDPFYTTRSTGHGLGLSVVLGIVSSHGAAISVDSVEGEGTTMTVLFPVHEGAPEAQEAPPESTAWTGGAGTVLVVDDERAVRHMIADVLAEAGYDVLQAGDGDEALDLLSSHSTSIRVVILDVTMPRRDGLATLSKLRHTHRELPVLLSSGRPIALPDDDDFVRLLPKPYTPDTILRAVSDELATSPGPGG